MKIYFSGVDFNSRSGPASFMTRLAHQLSLNGHILADRNDYDVALVSIEQSEQLLSNKPIIQRLDGIWFSQNEFYTKNINIKSTYQRADHVIWQSDFDKQMVNKWWGTPKTGSVIHNGTQLGKVPVTLEILHELRSRYEKIFVCSSNWHGQKRLRDNIELFKHLRETKYPYSCLVIMGSHPDVQVADMNIYYAGNLPHQMCAEFYAAADWMIHLAFADHCPNIVVEALAQECPVIHVNSGGTKEIVRENGICLKEPQEYNFELTDYENPSRIDVKQLFQELPKIKVDSTHLDIKIIAKKYEDVFESLI